MNPPKYLHVGLCISAGKTLDGSFFEGLRASRHRGWPRVTEPQGSRQNRYRFRHQTTYNVFVATHNSNTQIELEKRRKELIVFENSFGFDPAQNSDDLEQLKAILEN
jgi:hypothetical protein